MADEVKELRVREPGPHVLGGVDAVAGADPAKFPVVEFKPGFVGNRSPDHFPADLGGGRLEVGFVRGNRRR